eukprot:2486-Heterococcus_DN1.PRE.2
MYWLDAQPVLQTALEGRLMPVTLATDMLQQLVLLSRAVSCTRAVVLVVYDSLIMCAACARSRAKETTT